MKCYDKSNLIDTIEIHGSDQYTAKMIPSYHGTSSEKTRENNYMPFALKLASFNQPTAGGLGISH
jgi:hypothetical protein